MEREVLIKKTLSNIQKLPDSKLKEIADYSDFLIRQLEDQIITEGIKHLTSGSTAFDFLEEEKDIYTVNDLKERYK